MQLTHQQIGIIDDQGAPGLLRIELAIRPGTVEKLATRSVAGDSEFRFLGGQLRQGGFRIPVIVKIQRDVSPANVPSQKVAAAFDAERLTHLRLQATYPKVIEESHVVRYFDLANEGRGNVCPIVPPSIVCQHAVHALAPRCLKCNDKLEMFVAASNDNERVLVCFRCRNKFKFGDDTKIAIIKATVRKDTACLGCKQSQETCLKSAQFLNFFPARMLVFEHWDTDLESHMRKKRVIRQSPARSASATTSECDGELDEIGGIFQKVIRGLKTLHNLGVYGIDLSPRNIVLNVSRSSIDVCLDGLSFANDSDTPPYLRQVLGGYRPIDEYRPPEAAPSTTNAIAARYTCVESRHFLRIAPCPLGTENQFDPLVLPGDYVDIASSDQRFSPVRVGVTSSVVRGTTLELELSRCSLPSPCNVEVMLNKLITPASDLFSLGMLLLSLLMGEPQIQLIYESLPLWLEECRRINLRRSNSNRRLVKVLKSQSSPGLHLFNEIHSRLVRFGDALPLAEELLGMALRLVLRDPSGALHTYLQKRNDDPAEAWNRFEQDVERVARQFEVMRLGKAAASDQKWMGDQLILVRQRLEQLKAKLAPGKDTKMPTYERDRIEGALRSQSCGSGSAVDAIIWELLPSYGFHAAWLLEHLKRFEKPQDGTPSADLELDQRVLAEIVRLAQSVEADPAKLLKIQQIMPRIVELINKPASVPPEIMRRLVSLNSAVRPLVERIEVFDAALEHLRRCVVKLEQILLRPLSAVPANARSFEYRLARNERSQVGEQSAFVAINDLANIAAGLDDMYSELSRRRKLALKDWEAVPTPLQAALVTQANTAKQREKEFHEQVQKWRTQVNEAIGRLREYHRDITFHLLAPWDQRMKPTFWDWLLGKNRPISFVLRAESLHAIKRHDPIAIIHHLREWHLGPIAFHQAALLLEDIKEIQALRDFERQGGKP